MTVEEILRATGISDEQIQKLDQKIMEGFGKVLSEAGGAEARAAQAKTETTEIERRYQHMYENDIVPALNQWGSEKATLTAERDYYKSQNEGARSAGFLPKDAPGFTADPPRGADGRYVTGTNPVPGSPGLDATKILDGIREGVGNAQWAANEYARLYGEPMPESYDFNKEWDDAVRNRMKFKDWIAHKYKFDEKRKELSDKRQAEHDAAIRKDERTRVDKEWAERAGSNPGVRQAADSRYARVKQAVESGKAKDPLMMSSEQRRQQTREMIRSDIAERESGGNA
jgi:hypothetical protein